ncbi:MAG TPA: 16S rRNA (guanine(527)-N(7))-methyltransferase RsmG [Haliscomenobacter sp.]|uniref:16S rRNA (guanine(527)-N(7))-methyltransferase RsmG n=1 Tax=Haliscomenobacter sp. TaxID=2717303 RepID=UPI001D1CCB1A|nr:16S rRNA (guanine(527)-N(7))-methyltransferase RsmG [Haliscomenobacter sp.]MBK9490791.1 16S rRNA (guanine(527)-N(7))-methyltransferase RsmG [Haliscomenobacter sp.]HOY20294.1 16S rRNA (guanine(527)-N(7))-methyltransferase RsmG [Haliscomenobacter sp.]HPH21145.1 16S rRNA (guanine(527)-N(7))-methyltransferase RsmG [Haliscomenobacter sp.]
MQVILDYFPNLSAQQQAQFAQLDALYREWNAKINVVSRKDIDSLYAHHILHSLGIAKVINFKPGAEILDIGTGGGLPGIPLAILFPETQFTLVDGTGKKILVVKEIVQALGLTNVEAHHARAEELKRQFDFTVCRAVTTLDKLCAWSWPLIKRKQQHALPNGLITLKGGDLKEEIAALPKGTYVDKIPLSRFFKDPFYEEKYAVYVQA